MMTEKHQSKIIKSIPNSWLMDNLELIDKTHAIIINYFWCHVSPHSSGVYVYWIFGINEKPSNSSYTRPTWSDVAARMYYGVRRTDKHKYPNDYNAQKYLAEKHPPKTLSKLMKIKHIIFGREGENHDR